jgi:hypothetical protein
MPTAKEHSPKKIVYLWGAGATHAEARRLGAPISLLMRDVEEFGEGVASRILRRTGKSTVSSYGVGPGVDIEKLISLLAASGVGSHSRLAEKLRVNYFAELRSSLVKAKVLEEPALAIQLMKMHVDRKFKAEVEVLSGIISTNHDGLLQVASQHAYGGINPGFAFESDDFSASTAAPLILHLHGSFTWRFGTPIRIERLRRTSVYADTVWIPPTILKETKNYPFNKLSALAYELLARRCDVLRVIGASLTQNDWNILSLIFNAQRHRAATRGKPFTIELIMSHSGGEGIKRECSYLKSVLPIGYLTDGKFADYKENKAIPPESDLANPFAYWLSEKMQFHRLRDELKGSPYQTRPLASELRL